MRILTAFDAITSCRFGDAREAGLRQEDSSAQKLLPDAAESACLCPMTDVLEKLVNRWPASKIEDLMPWAWGPAIKAERAQKAA